MHVLYLSTPAIGIHVKFTEHCIIGFLKPYRFIQVEMFVGKGSMYCQYTNVNHLIWEGAGDEDSSNPLFRSGTSGKHVGSCIGPTEALNYILATTMKWFLSGENASRSNMELRGHENSC